VVSGLPGTGKSRLCREVRTRTDAAILESDTLRRELFGRPDHSPSESRRLFAAIHAAIDRLLAEKRSVILDATNLAERERVPLYNIAERNDARLLLVHVVAPAEAVKQRLAGRTRGQDPQDQSQAGIDVYLRMAANMGEIRRPHRIVDTSLDIEADVDAIVEEME
jgi:predicted kinase